MGDDPEALRRHAGLRLALRAWSHTARLGNMATERLLSLFRKSFPLRCNNDRLMCAGFISQIQSKHLAAVGHDVRKLTRRRLLDMEAPLKVGRRRFAEKRARR